MPVREEGKEGGREGWRVFLCVLESSGEGTYLACAAAAVSQSEKRRAAFQNKLEAEERRRKSGKGMIMKNFKASLLFVPPLARPIGGGTAERRDGEGEGREMLEEELTS